MKSSFKKYQNYFVYGGFLLVFLVLVLVATSGNAPYGKTVFEGFALTWYSIFIITGLIFGAIMMYFELKRVGHDPDILWDGLLVFVPLAIAGARLWYVLFNLEKYGDIMRIFNLTEGGLGIHGSIIVTFVVLIWFTRRKKIDYWFVLDLVAPAFLIGQTLGRWGNFMNQELYGPVADNLNWLPPFIREQMLVNGAYRHPTFLYESIWNLIGLVLILVLRRKRIFKLGDIMAFYLVWYGVGRIPTEWLRLNSGVTEPLMAFGIPVSIATSVGFIIAGVLIFVLKRVFRKDLGLYDDYGKKAVLFDLDGTLLDTADLIYKNIKQTFKEYFPDKVFTENELKAFVGPTLNESFSWYETNPKRLEKMIETYRKHNAVNHQTGVKPFDHAKETLEALRASGYLIGIVSSKKREVVEFGLQQNDLLKLVDVVVGSDDVTKHKPDAEPIEKALKQLAVSPDNAVYVGDHENDIKAAKNAGVKSVGVAYSIHYAKLLSAQPDYVIDDLEKLLHIF